MTEQTNINLNLSELDEKWKSIVKTVVENDRGDKSVAFLDVKIERGRVKFRLIAKKNHKETKVNATTDWLL
jgi:hypothetical protein